MWKLPPLWMRFILGLLIGPWGGWALYLGIEAIITKKTDIAVSAGGIGLGGSGETHGWQAVQAGVGHVVASLIPLSVAFSVIFLPSFYCRLGIWRDDQNLKP